MNRRAKFRLLIFAGLVVLLLIAATRSSATNLTGTFKHPDGSLVNGKLIFLLSQPARLSDNSAQIVPMVKIFSVTNGTLETAAFVYGNDVLVPAGTHYLVRLVDGSNNLLFEQKWYISGTALDLGTLTPTTTGVVLPDPLLRNTGTAQTVQGPVNFSSPITAFTLTLNGNISPAAGDVFDLGNAGAPWRELYALRWNNFVHPGNQTSTVGDPAGAPTVAVEATSGGSMDNSTRYYKIELINWNGTTLASPAQTLTPTTCGGAACKVRVSYGVSAGQTEWKTGAVALRVLASSDNVNFFRQTGFPGELDTTGPLANSHYMPGDVILSSLTLSGTGPAATNTATIDADQVALNAVCDRTNNICKGTLQYNANTGAGVAAQTGTTPLVVGILGARVRGHGQHGDVFTSGTTRQCNFAHIKLGCVMVMNTNNVDIRGLNVTSASHGYMVYKSQANASATANNRITIGEADVKTTGSLVVDNIKVAGGNYYLNFPLVHLSTQTSGTGCAAVSTDRVYGGHWNFSGPSTWVVRDNCHAIRSDTGPTDPDRGVGFQGLPNAMSNLTIEDIEVQMSANSGNKTPFVMTNLFFNMNRVTPADWAPVAGATAFMEIGVNADGQGACCGFIRIQNSTLTSHANVASTLKLVSNNGNTIREIALDNNFIPGSGASSVAFDMNSLFIPGVKVTGDDGMSCDPNATAGKITNIAANTAITCLTPRQDVASNRKQNLTVRGGLQLVNPGAASPSVGNLVQCWWPSNNNFNCYLGDGETTANRIFNLNASNRLFTWYQSDGTTTLVNYGTNNIGIGRANSAVSSTLAFPNNWALTARNNAGSADLGLIKLNTSDQAEIGDAGTPARFPRTSGNPPMVVDSPTEVANLNAQQWHSKTAIDFSGALDFGSIAAQTCAELTINATGAVADNAVASSWPAALEAGLVGIMRISAADTVTVRLCNVTLLSIDPASRTYGGRVVK